MNPFDRSAYWMQAWQMHRAACQVVHNLVRLAIDQVFNTRRG